MGRTELVEPYYLKALRIHQRLGNHANEAETFNNMGIQASIVGDYPRALRYLQRALNIAARYLTGRRALECTASCQVDLAIVYAKQNDYPTACRYAQQSAGEYARLGDNDGQANALYRVAKWSLQLGDTTRTRQVAHQCLKLAAESNSPSIRRDASDVLGKLALGQHQLLVARAWHQQALRIDEELKMASLRANDLVALARVELAAGNRAVALRHAQLAAQVAQSARSLSSLCDAHEQLSNIYERGGNTGQALAHFRRYVALRDSVHNQEAESAALQQRLSYEYQLKETALRAAQSRRQAVAQLEIRRQRLVRNSLVASAILLLLLLLGLWQRFRYQRRTTAIIAHEKQRSEELLLNILPAETAHELKENGYARARLHELVTVLFADVVGFTHAAENLTPDALVAALDAYFAAFDGLSERFGLEKIKTIGDAYLVAGGLNGLPDDAPAAVVRCALAMQQTIAELHAQRTRRGEAVFIWRIGIHTGPVVAGVVGIKKFAYDIWGDTVNTAARMEQSSAPGRINVSAATYELTKDQFAFEARGQVAAKNKGEVAMYFLALPTAAGVMA